jgi:integrase
VNPTRQRRRLKQWPRVRKAGDHWEVDTRIRGKGKRVKFEEEDEARVFAQKAEEKRRGQGEEYFSLSPSQRAQAEEAFELLARYSPDGTPSLVDIVKDYLPQLELSKQGREVTFTQFKEEVIRAKEADGASPRYLQDLHSRLGAFERDFGRRRVATIQTPEIDKWLRGLKNSRTSEPVSAVTRNNYRRILVVAFSHALAQGYVSSHPVLPTARGKGKPAETGILAVGEAAALLEACDEMILPYVAVGLFAGIRRAEMERMDWADIDLVEGLIEVKAKNAKTASRRFVRISDNLKAWIMPVARTSGPLTPTCKRLKNRLKKAREAAGIELIPHNAFRHIDRRFRQLRG